MSGAGGARSGMVYLVGAGPGDAGLVTRRALELVRSADVLFVDRLVPRELVDEARPDAQCTYVGKSAGDHALPQDEINERLVKAALAGRSVVRLKGGDPYLFGRGGEEAMCCREAGVRFEVVPAVTSAFAACADAGIPVTHRDLSRHVTVVTASAGRDGRGDPDYRWLAKSDGTIVLLMGLRRVGHVAEELVGAGMSPQLPVAVVSRGTTSEQRTVSGTLGTIADLVAAAELASPAIIVVGEVVRLRDELAWFEQRPLFGARVAVTRARAQASGLVARLGELGASVAEIPTIRIEALAPAAVDRVVSHLAELDTLAFTSRNGVDIFFARLAAAGLDARALGGVRVAVVGTASAEACRERGIEPDVIPPRGARTSVGLLEQLEQLELDGTSCAVIRAEVGDDRLHEGLEKGGANVELVRAYRTVVEPASQAQVAALVESDLVTFTSESTVRNAVAMLPAGATMPPAVTIGPVTTAAARDAGIQVLQEAGDPSIEALVAAVLDARAVRS